MDWPPPGQLAGQPVLGPEGARARPPPGRPRGPPPRRATVALKTPLRRPWLLPRAHPLEHVLLLRHVERERDLTALLLRQKLDPRARRARERELDRAVLLPLPTDGALPLARVEHGLLPLDPYRDRAELRVLVRPDEPIEPGPVRLEIDPRDVLQPRLLPDLEGGREILRGLGAAVEEQLEQLALERAVPSVRRAHVRQDHHAHPVLGQEEHVRRVPAEGAVVTGELHAVLLPDDEREAVGRLVVHLDLGLPALEQVALRDELLAVRRLAATELQEDIPRIVADARPRPPGREVAIDRRIVGEGNGDRIHLSCQRVRPREPRPLRRRGVEGRPLHPQGPEDPVRHHRLEGLVERLLRLHRARRDIPAGRHEGVGVLEGLAEPGGRLHGLHRREHLLGGLSGALEDPLHVLPRQPRAGAHRVPHGEPLRRVRIPQGEGRQDLGGRGIPAELSLVDEPGHEQRRQRLAHGRHAEQRIRRHRVLLAELPDAEPLLEDDLPPLHDRHRDAGDLEPLPRVLDERIKLAQPRLVQRAGRLAAERLLLDAAGLEAGVGEARLRAAPSPAGLRAVVERDIPGIAFPGMPRSGEIYQKIFPTGHLYTTTFPNGNKLLIQILVNRYWR